MSQIDLETSLGGREALERVSKWSMLSAPRLTAITRALKAVAGLDGETAEVGCNAGGTSRLIATLNGGRRHWAIDTFVGLVDVCRQDDLKNGTFRGATCADVTERLSDLTNVDVRQGFFPGCAPADMAEARFAFVHIDVDTYRSIHDCFAWFAQRMVPGGVIALDDVIGRGTRGAKTAWKEILAARCGWEVIEKTDPQAVVRFGDR